MLKSRIKADMREMKSDTSVLRLEMRAGFAELRNDVQDVRRSVGTVLDSLADFRREYNEHNHGND